jgi:hypothetical protein
MLLSLLTICLLTTTFAMQCVPDVPAVPAPVLPPAKMYGQCGGETHPGPFKCEYPLKCSVLNKYYSQCVEDPTFLAQPAVNVWEQCGGKGYTGSTRCNQGLTCVEENEWYSGCRPAAR